MFTFLSKSNANYEKLFYDFQIKSITGENIELSDYKGKTILLVNVASNCGFTKQYTDLQNLYEKYKDQNFIVLGVPSNQFGGQEPGSPDEIKQFCAVKFDVSFPMTCKMTILGDRKDELFSYIASEERNGFDNVDIAWNFHKCLFDPTGMMVGSFPSSVEPFSDEILNGLGIQL